MIPRGYIQEWAKKVPWQEPRQIEQDLIISAAIINIYANPILKECLAFRGGTALNKLFFSEPLRYSEDIDLVQIKSSPIGKIIDECRDALDNWLGTPKRDISEGRVTLTYKVLSDDGFPIKLKIEINSREHFAVMGYQDIEFACESAYLTKTSMITTYFIEELLGTKLRALFQRRKGRDLFDLFIALEKFKNLDPYKVIQCFNAYMLHSNTSVSQTRFIENLTLKLANNEFRKDIIPLLPRSHKFFDPDSAFLVIKDRFLSKL